MDLSNYLKAGYNKWRKLRKTTPSELRAALRSGDALQKLVDKTTYKMDGVPGRVTTMATWELSNMVAVLRTHDDAIAHADQAINAVNGVLAKYGKK